MTAEVTEITGEIRGVKVQYVNVSVAGHTVEQVLSYDVAEAEAVYGRPFDDEMDEHIQMGMFAIDRIAADGTIGKVASATSYVLDGKCIRTAKIEHCSEIEPGSSHWRMFLPDGSLAPRVPWSCVLGTEPMPHSDLPADDDVTRFLRGVGDRVTNSLQGDLKPDRRSGWADTRCDGSRCYHLWYSRSPWIAWDNVSYRIHLRQGNNDANGLSRWHADVGFIYLKESNLSQRGLVIGLDVRYDQTFLIEREVLGKGKVVLEYGVLQVSQYGGALDRAFASTLADTLKRFIEVITPVVDASEAECNRTNEDS